MLRYSLSVSTSLRIRPSTLSCRSYVVSKAQRRPSRSKLSAQSSNQTSRRWRSTSGSTSTAHTLSEMACLSPRHAPWPCSSSTQAAMRLLLLARKSTYRCTLATTLRSRLWRWRSLSRLPGASLKVWNIELKSAVRMRKIETSTTSALCGAGPKTKMATWWAILQFGEPKRRPARPQCKVASSVSLTITSKEKPEIRWLSRANLMFLVPMRALKPKRKKKQGLNHHRASLDYLSERRIQKRMMMKQPKEALSTLIRTIWKCA